MILFLGNRWKSSFSVTWMDWYGIKPKQGWNGNSNGMCSVKWMKGLGFEPRDREREKARGELIFQFYSKRVRAERQSNHNSKAMVQVQILQLELPKDSGQVDWSTKEGICKISTKKQKFTHVTRDELIQSLNPGSRTNREAAIIYVIMLSNPVIHYICNYAFMNYICNYALLSLKGNSLSIITTPNRSHNIIYKERENTTPSPSRHLWISPTTYMNYICNYASIFLSIS